MSFCFLFCKKKTETHVYSNSAIENYISKEKLVNNENKICEKYTFLDWVNIEGDRKNRTTLYEADSYKIKLKKFLNEEYNRAGKLLFVNGTIIDTIENEFSHKPIIYSCIKTNQIIIFIQESDENGSFAYRIYYSLNDKIIYSGTLNIAPIEDNVSFNKFFGLVKKDNRIQITLLEDSYFDSKSFKNRQSSNLKHQ